MKRNEVPISEAAFSRLELLLVLATLILLAGVALPALASTKTRSQRLLCEANLRQLGHAYHVWGNDRGNQTPCRTLVSAGGTFGSPSPLKNNAWWQLQVLSNELVTPKILVCPADKGVGAPRVIANNWGGTDATGGYATVGFRDHATSYTVALDAFFDQPRSILSDDRNVRPSVQDVSCSSMVGTAWGFYLAYPQASWTNSIHLQAGNVLFYDGQVEQLSVPGFTRALNAPYLGEQAYGSDNGELHFLIPN